MATSRLTTLGGFAFDVSGTSTRSPATRKARALMSFLIMNRGANVSREALLDVFWADADPDHARASLKTALWSIRRCLVSAGVQTDEFIIANKSILRWTHDTAVDALEFAELTARDDPPADRKALQLYRGDFLEGDYDNWTVTERERLAALYETVLARVARTAKDTDAAQRFIARNPYDEDIYATLIESELAAGRRSSAASWVERCRNALSEVGEKPSAAFEGRFGNISYVEPQIAGELALPFSGRENELALLAAKFRRAMSAQGSVTLAHGVAGIGKSMLLDRAARMASECGLRVIAVRCQAEVPNSFAPWEEIFSAVTGGNFDKYIAAHASDLAAAIAQAITSELRESAAIIVDDAHELAGEALEIFDALARSALLRHAIVVGSRPEGIPKLRSRLADVPFEELPLGNLDRNDLKWALAQALGGEQSDVLDILYHRTAGHPLFFTGLLNSLVTAGALARERDRWQLTKPIDSSIELPDTLKRYIEMRLSARGEVPHTLACALALEPAATADDLIAVLRADESSVFDALDDLLALGLIMQPASGTQFAFAHDLIREVAAVGLNAGRRAVLHRAFADRLNNDTGRETSLRLARHLDAAGESFAAAQAYLRSAEQALQLNAVQAAIDRCDAGIAAAEHLQRTAAYGVLIALHNTAARGALAAGDAEQAVARAREGVRLAREGGDVNETARSMLGLAVMEGAAFHVLQQQSAAVEAVHDAKLCGDAVLEAQALVQEASAARELGLRDDALQAANSARSAALKYGRSDIVQTALEETLRTQITWWLFPDALDSARVSVDAARRAAPLIEASFLHVRSALWYLLERFDAACSDLQSAIRITNDHPLPVVQFSCYYMAAKVALIRKNWDDTLAALNRAAALANIARLPRNRQALALLRIDALLQRNAAGDNAIAHELTDSLGESTLGHGMVGWSDCIELARACDAARMRTGAAHDALRRALNAMEENAHRAPLDADRAFGRLAKAASEVEETAIANRARGRADYYKSRRIAAAGAEWGARGEAAL